MRSSLRKMDMMFVPTVNLYVSTLTAGKDIVIIYLDNNTSNWVTVKNPTINWNTKYVSFEVPGSCTVQVSLQNNNYYDGAGRHFRLCYKRKRKRMKWGYVSKKRQRMGKTSGFYDLGPVEFTDRIFIGLYVKKWP